MEMDKQWMQVTMGGQGECKVHHHKWCYTLNIGHNWAIKVSGEISQVTLKARAGRNKLHIRPQDMILTIYVQSTKSSG